MKLEMGKYEDYREVFCNVRFVSYHGEFKTKIGRYLSSEVRSKINDISIGVISGSGSGQSVGFAIYRSI
jgi:hypothetical protein